MDSTGAKDLSGVARSAALAAEAPTSCSLGNDGRILEGLVTTLNADGSVNVAPMGPIVADSMEWLLLRPFNTSTTFANLRRERCGVFHVTDDVEMLAQAAVAANISKPTFVYYEGVKGAILAGACRWYAFEVYTIDATPERAAVIARVTSRGVLREFFGFNRAKHAVLEAAIVATRVHLAPPANTLAEFDRLQIAVQKTGAAAEHRAMAFLREYVRKALSESSQ